MIFIYILLVKNYIHYWNSCLASDDTHKSNVFLGRDTWALASTNCHLNIFFLHHGWNKTNTFNDAYFLSNWPWGWRLLSFLRCSPFSITIPPTYSWKLLVNIFLCHGIPKLLEHSCYLLMKLVSLRMTIPEIFEKAFEKQIR